MEMLGYVLTACVLILIFIAGLYVGYVFCERKMKKTRNELTKDEIKTYKAFIDVLNFDGEKHED